MIFKNKIFKELNIYILEKNHWISEFKNKTILKGKLIGEYYVNKIT